MLQRAGLIIYTKILKIENDPEESIIILWAVSIPILLNYNEGGVHTWYYTYGYDDREFLVYRSKLRQHTVTIIFD